MSHLARYGLVPLTIGAASLFRVFLTDLLGIANPPLMLYLFPVIVCAWYGGLGPGLLATAMSATAGMLFFMDATGGTDWTRFLNQYDIVRLAIFVAEGCLLSVLAWQFHRSLQYSVTAERQMRDALRNLAKSEQRVNSIVDNIVDAVITINQDGVIESWNRAATKIFGYKIEEVLGRHVEMLWSESQRRTFRSIAGHYAHGEFGLAGMTQELIARRKDGTDFPIDLAVSTMRIGAKSYYTGIVRDITERIRDAAELKNAKETAEAASRAKTQFLANMSHEIRTPLGVIAGFTDLALGARSDQERVHAIATVQRNAQHLAALVDDLLDLTKAEAGRLRFVKCDVDLTQVLDGVRDALADTAKAKGLKLTVESDGPVPNAFVSDPQRLQQILSNVVGNAVKFTERGSVALVIRARPEQTHSGHSTLEFVVTDSGPGIAAEMQERLFTPFSQADPSYSRKFGGTGLGLALSRMLAQSLGGDVLLLRSAPGKGSAFSCTIEIEPTKSAIPIRIERQVLDNGVHIANVVQDPSKARDRTRLSGVRVLLVEDSADNRLMVSRFLKNAGAVVETAVDGNDGVQKAISLQPDIVVMDIQMPSKDGYAATSDLREKGFAKPIIALTAHAIRDEKQRGLRNGFNDYLTKPVNKGDLVETIRRFSPHPA